ncbi:MAG: hypothetical protein R6V06_07350 [Kiritimatiellia bacterium]
MKFFIYMFFALLPVLELSAQFGFFKSRVSFDYNEDGVIRCAILGTGAKNQQVDNKQTCIDLEKIIRDSEPGMPVRVKFEEINETKTIMGWWYHPESRQQRTAFTSSSYDYVFLAENKSVVTKYPELFFEGVRISQSRFSPDRTRVMLLMMDSSPVSSVRDNSIAQLTEFTYRVADGCGLKVVPAALAWQDVMKHHILPGRSLLRRRANSFLAASAIWCRITGDRVPNKSLTTGWIVKKTASRMARSARDSVENALTQRHYSRPFRGVIRCENRIRTRYMVYHAGTVANSALRSALNSVINASGQSVVQYSTADWYEEGFDRNAAPVDLVCGSIQEMEPVLDRGRYTSTEFVPENLPDPVRVVYNRNPSNDDDGTLVLENLEDILMEGYNFARRNECIFIPYQVAWARLWSIDPDYIKPADGKTFNDWLNYMLANMLYAALSGRYQMPPEKGKPQHCNNEHPRGFHRTAVRIGWHTLQQLSGLRMHRNTLVTSSRGWHVDRSEPAFIRLCLLEPPEEPVRVLCAPSDPDMLKLSHAEFTFDHKNYNIEQSLRCSVAGTGKNKFCTVLINTVSDDDASDGISARHVFLLNRSETESSGFSFNTNRLSASAQSFVMLKPDTRPVDFVNVSIFQNGVETASVCFSPDYYAEHPVCLFPAAEAAENGRCEVRLKALSRDKRFNGFEKRYGFDLDYSGFSIPDVKVIAPDGKTPVSGPAYVTAEAVAVGAEQPFGISLFCGKKRLGLKKGSSIKTEIEMGTPLSRLTAGEYPLWAALRLENGIVVSSPVTLLTVE